jgi:hypothetical protein
VAGEIKIRNQEQEDGQIQINNQNQVLGVIIQIPGNNLIMHHKIKHKKIQDGEKIMLLIHGQINPIIRYNHKKLLILGIMNQYNNKLKNGDKN